MGRRYAFIIAGLGAFVVMTFLGRVGGSIREPKGYQTRCLLGHQAPVAGLEFSPDGRLLISADHNGRVILWDAHTGRQIRMTEHRARVVSLRIAPDGATLALGTSPNSVDLLNIHSGNLIKQFHVPNSPLSLSFSSDGNNLATSYGGEISGVDVWEIPTGRAVIHLGEGASLVEFSHNSSLLLTGRRRSGIDGAVLVWDTQKWRVQRVLKGHQSPPLVARFATGDRTFVSGSYDSTARVWDLNTGKQARKLGNHRYAVIGVAYAHKGEWIVTAAGQAVFLWEVRTGRKIAVVEGRASVMAVAVSPNQNTLAVGRSNGSIELLSL